MKQQIAAAFIASLLLAASPNKSQAAAGTGWRTITQMGCHMGSSVCYVTINGDAVGPSGCTGNSIRWDPTAVNGKETFAQLTAAYLAGKQVYFYVTDTCFTGQATFPTFSYYNVTG